MSSISSARATFASSTQKLLKKVEMRLKDILSQPSAVRKECLATLTAGGKRIRPALTVICGHYRNLEMLIPTAVSVELVHTASLIHDDILDDSETRRGVPTIYATEGYELALQTGDFIFSLAFTILSDTKNPKLLEILSSAARSLSIGEIQQKNSAYSTDQSLEVYYDKIGNKTANLFEAACRMGAVCGESSSVEEEALGNFGLNLGLAFQVYDDILDFIGDEKLMGKSRGSDLKDGMLTLPMFLALCELKDKSFLTKVIQAKENNKEEIKRAIALVVGETNSIGESRRQAKGFVDQALSSLDVIKNKPVKEELRSLAQTVLERNS